MSLNPTPRRPALSAVPPAAELARLHAQAHQEAARLRREAIDDVWRGADALWASALDTAGRSATRLAARLAHHRQLRGA